MLDDAQTVRLADVEAYELAERLGASRDPSASPAPTTPPSIELTEGMLLAGRYRILQGIHIGWVGYDERLNRPVIVERLTGSGGPAERVRREAARDVRLSDAVVLGDEAFAIRTATVL